MKKLFLILVCSSKYSEPLSIVPYEDLESALYDFDNDFDLNKDNEFYDHVFLYECFGVHITKLCEKSC